MVIYLDTSAFLKLYLLEEGSDRVNEIVTAQDEPLPVWHLLEAEFRNALRLQVFWKGLTPDQAEDLWYTFGRRRSAGLYFTPEVDWASLLDACHRLGAETPRLGCRTLDILHGACCLQLGIQTFVTFDQRQSALAAHVGLNPLP